MGAADDGHQRQVHVHHLRAPELDAHLADRLQKRQRFDVADCAADLDHAHVGIARAQADTALDLIGDMGNHLHRRAEIVAAPLLGDDPFIDPPGGEIAVPPGGGAHEALVVTQIQVRFRTVCRDEDLAVLERAHGARIDVDIRVELDHRHLEAARLEIGAQ